MQANGNTLPYKSANLPKLVPNVDTGKTWPSKRKYEIYTSIEEEEIFLKSVNQNASGRGKGKGIMSFGTTEKPSNSRLCGFLRRQFAFCLFQLKFSCKWVSELGGQS